MYRNKKDVDKHVESLISKLSAKEFKNRAYSVARLYFEVGDYVSCQRYVEQYLTQKDTNAAAHKLLGQALLKLGQKQKALEHFKNSLNIDPTQKSLLLEFSKLMGEAEYDIGIEDVELCVKMEAMFPMHPATFNLREKLISVADADPEAITNLLKSELAVRPKDEQLHSRLIKHYVENNKVKEAFEHSCSVEFGENNFRNDYYWYECLSFTLKHNSHIIKNDWLYHLLLLTVKERICVLSLTETPNGTSRGIFECSELLNEYDLAIQSVITAGASPGFADFHVNLLEHHRGQFALHAATFLLKKAKKDVMTWRDAIRLAAPLMLIAWHTVPIDLKVNWLTHAPEPQQNAAQRWYLEGTYRCSQSGHYLLSNIQDKSQIFLDKISQTCSDVHWRDKIYEKLCTEPNQLTRLKDSHLASYDYKAPTLRLPKKNEIENYDVDAQREYSNSLHHFVWLLLNYKKYSLFKCTLFDVLTTKSQNYANCGPETLNKLDVLAFLYSATLTCRQQKLNHISFITTDRPSVLPANISDLLCTLSQMKWWDCAYKFTQNKLGTELTDIRATLSRGIEVVRCIDNHGLDPELLCFLGRIFSERAKLTKSEEEKHNIEIRAGVYYSSAIPLLEKLKCKMTEIFTERRMFDYTHKELCTRDLNSLIEESKFYVAVNYLGESEYEKAIELLSNLKSPQALYYLGDTYKRIALEENNSSRDTSIEIKTKCAAIMYKAKSYAYKALDRLNETEVHANKHTLYPHIQQLIEEIEANINKIDVDLSDTIITDMEVKYSSDENLSLGGNEHIPPRFNSQVFCNKSSTPKQLPNTNNTTNYRTAVDSQLFDSNQVDQQFLERIEQQIKNLQKRDTTINDFMEQTKNWFEENRQLGNQIINTIQSNIQNSTDQFKLLKISVDQVKDQIDECRNECKDVGDLKKQIAELKKEVNKLKKAPSEQAIDESDLYNLDDDYRTNDNTSTFTTQLPFTPPQVMPPFNQRLVPPFPVPPNPYQLYGQNLYNLYNQYSQFAQPSSVPGAPPIFDSSRPQVNYPNVYPTPDQMYLDVAHLVPPGVPSASAIPGGHTLPTVPAIPAVPTIPVVSVPTSITSVTISKPTSTIDVKENTHCLPVNVVITSSDPLPTCTTTPVPILSVTIPPKHIKGIPHNYQIPMPSSNDTKVIPPPIFSFPTPGNKTISTTPSSLTNWSQSTVFKTTTSTTTTTTVSADSSLLCSSKTGDSFDNSTSVVDGIFTVSSPNTSLNKSRTLSERSNTSVENYDPCPDFKPIIPLPAEVKVTTGEEDEIVIFSARAKLFRFVDKQWKERGLGEMKLLKHKVTEKVRVLMRREQVHKICANHMITPEIEIKPMKNETKAYFWVANDFADETVVLEKFCIRFKTADIAQQFYNTFENARKESEISNADISKAENKLNLETSKVSLNQLITPEKNSQTTDSQTVKTVVGGFTFSSTPTFKSVLDTTTNDTKITETSTNKVNVFSGLSFKTTTNSPFSNLFNNSSNQVKENPVPKQESANKLNISDTVDEFEPTVEFKPVVPLPALVDQKTGEEDETILFEHRAKLLRFDAASKEWKERGLGNIKLLMHKDITQKLRLLMRREQVMKVCCNHAVTKDIAFQKMPNMDKAVTWCAKDFSEGELVPETFCLRFKTVQACDNFIEAVKLAQSKLKEDSKTIKEEQNVTKQGSQVGFGDKFKPKPGSWKCENCYTNNLENFNKCACCEQPKPQNIPIVTSSIVIPTASNWPDSFKPKPGTWECKECFIRNEGNVTSCNACNSPRDSSITKTEIKLASENAPKFTFGIPSHTTSSHQTKSEELVLTAPTVSGWGDKFKPKEGTWECKQCFVRNESDVEQCSACSNPKNPNAIKKEPNSIFEVAVSGPKFNFGIPQTSANDQKIKSETTSIFDGTGTHKFSFGIPVNIQDKVQSVLTFGNQKPVTGIIFANPKPIVENDSPLNFTVKKNDKSDKTMTPIKPALLPTPRNDTSATPFIDGKDTANIAFGGVKVTSSLSFGGVKESGTFDFVFKPKTPPKNKNLIKSPKSDKGDESDGNEYASEDEGHHIHFSPVIPMPDKIEVVTGEENEDELYGHRAKLFRFVSGEWKERGVGVVKILKHKDTGKLRVVMRREQVLKICLNHSLTAEIIYKQKDERSWFFIANDFSEGELNLQQFCIRFKTKEIAAEFRDAIDKARGEKSISIVKKDSETGKKDNDSDDVVFVSEIQATKEEKQIAKKLMLPENFFTYKNKEPCQGCRGCKDDDSITDTTPDTKNNIEIESSKVRTTTVTTTVSTPIKTSSPRSSAQFQSPTNSIYGTPTNVNKTVDTSIFRTPLESIGSNIKSPAPVTTNNNVAKIDATNKENTFIQKPSIFGLGEHKILFGTSQNNPAKQFGTSETETPTNTKISITASNSSTLDVSEVEKQSPEHKSIFGSAQNKSIFGETKSIFSNSNSGMSTNKSIFGFSADIQRDIQKPEVKSIFGGDTSQKSGNIFGSNTSAQTKPGTGNFGSTDTPAFGSSASDSSKVFGSGTKPVFENTSSQSSTWIFGSNKIDQKPQIVPPPNTDNDKKVNEVQKDNESTKKEIPFKVDNNLTFAALSSGGSGFNIPKKQDFQWEGAGQQLFVTAKKTPGKETSDKSKSESGTCDDSETTAGAEEEYDPHYEPIVPLPDKIIVTTGEEDEEKLFGERCKLYRYDEKSREWKERGIGEMKILYHPERKTYRLLLRREQVHKAVLNMLLFMDLELRPMKNSDRAWTWAGRNYAETSSGEQETLAVRFKSINFANAFQNKVVECVRKLQAAEAQAIREQKESNDKAFGNVAPLRLPKHLEDSARADTAISAKVEQQTQSASGPNFVSVAQNEDKTESKSNDELNKQSVTTEVSKQVHFQEPEEEEEEHAEDEEDYEHDYENSDYEAYYNEDEEESPAYYTCNGEAIVQQGVTQTTCAEAHVQVLYDQEIYSPKILVTDSATGEILADMLIHTETEFQMSGDSCTWSGTDYTSNDPVDKTVTINFHDSDMAMQFYDSCETSKAATYSSTDPEP